MPASTAHATVAPRVTALHDDPITVARGLLGQRLVRIVDTVNGPQRISGTIVETEAYLGAPDRAAHTFGGRRTPRNESMYLPGGHAYVYFIYGLHHCLNVVCGEVDEGVAVLIRALEPVEGLDEMRTRRPRARRLRDLCSGPARLTQALDIDRRMDGTCLTTSPELFIERQRAIPEQRIASSPRIGVEYAGDWARRLLRFIVADNPHVSR